VLSLSASWPARSLEIDEIFGDAWNPESDDGTLMVAEQEQTFWLSTYRKDTAFLQVCHRSDRMSAVFGTNLDQMQLARGAFKGAPFYLVFMAIAPRQASPIGAMGTGSGPARAWFRCKNVPVIRAPIVICINVY